MASFIRVSGSGRVNISGTGHAQCITTAPPSDAKLSMDNPLNLGENPNGDDFVVSGVTYVTPGVGGTGGAAQAGAGQGMQAANASLYDIDARTDPLSMGFWIKRNGGAASELFFLAKWSSNTGYMFSCLGDGTLEIKFMTSAVGIKVQTDTLNAHTAVFDNTFHFLAFTYDGSGNASGVNLYLDGVALSTTIISDALTGNTSRPSQSLCLMRRATTTTTTEGIYDIVGIWEQELTASDILVLYSNP